MGKKIPKQYCYLIMRFSGVERLKSFQEKNKDLGNKNGGLQYKKLQIFQMETHRLLQLHLPINDYNYYAEREVSRVVTFLPYHSFGVLILNPRSVFQKMQRSHLRIRRSDT